MLVFRGDMHTFRPFVWRMFFTLSRFAFQLNMHYGPDVIKRK